MNIKRNITINLDANEVKEIIADRLDQEGYEVTADDIQINVGSRFEGYGMAEHQVVYFAGCTVDCAEK